MKSNALRPVLYPNGFVCAERRIHARWSESKKVEGISNVSRMSLVCKALCVDDGKFEI